MLNTIFKKYLLEIGTAEKNIIEIDLTRLSNAICRDPIYLYERILQLIQKNDKEIISFVDVILDLASLDNIDLYVTGSNSKMLSTDIVTEFRDKATNIRIMPLSYEEFYE